MNFSFNRTKNVRDYDIILTTLMIMVLNMPIIKMEKGALIKKS